MDAGLTAQQRIQARVDAGARAVAGAVVVNAVLAVVKIAAGVVGNAYALIADGIESCADIASSLIVLRGLRLSTRAADAKYHYGFGKAEALATLVVSLVLCAAAAFIAIAAAREIITPHHTPAPFTLGVLLVVVVVKELLFRRLGALGGELQSGAVTGEAWHQRSDAITSAAAFIGISVALIGGPGFECADDYAAILCALVIAFTGMQFMRRAVGDLMDRAPDAAVVERIRQAAEAVPGVLLVEQLFVRRLGLSFAVDMHVHADPEITLRSAHELSGAVKAAVRRADPFVDRVLIHMEPANQLDSKGPGKNFGASGFQVGEP